MEAASAESFLALLQGRYRSEGVLGRGAFGLVFRAIDTLRGEPVAIKQLPLTSVHAWQRVQREMVALRLARLPGVVRMRDAFEAAPLPCWVDAAADEDEDVRTLAVDAAAGPPPPRRAAFLVMDMVEGYPFGLPRPRTWEQLRATFAALVVNLVRVHFAGLVHRDLKPANVLVSPDGAPVILDLGLAGDRRGRGGGFAPRYAAPELKRGEGASAASDIYAVGVMVLEALGGRAPDVGGWAAQVDRLDLPVPTRALLCAMVAERPSQRPSGVEIAEALGTRPPVLHAERLATMAAQLTPEDLRPLFAGSDRCLHLREDGAEALYARSGGSRERVLAEANSWICAGRASYVDDRLVIGREVVRRLAQGELLDPGAVVHTDLAAREVLYVVRALFPHASLAGIAHVLDQPEEAVARLVAGLGDRVWRLADGSLGTDLRAGDLDEGAFLAKHLDRLLEVLPPNAERRVRLLASTRAGDSRLVSEICAWVERRTDDGAFEEAVSLFEDALSLARAHDHRDAELRVLACVVQEAASRPTPARLNIAARLIGEAERDDAAPLSALVAAATLWSSGEFGRALAELRDVGPSSMERLELTRMAIGANLRAAVSTEDAVAWLESWRAWAAATPSRGAHWWAALGRVRYLRQDLDGAAEAHALAAAQEPSPAGALRFAISRVQCLVDGGRHEEALTVGQELLRTSVQLREPYSEARLWVILRAATYRSGAEMEPDDELVPLLRAVAPPLVLQAAVTEAAVAWRGGDVARCAVVAARGLVGFPSDTPAALLLRALALQHSGDVQEGVAVLNALGPATPPGVALQVRSLVSRVSASAQDTDVLKGLATMFPGSSWHLRREVLSVEECVRGMSPDFVPG